MINLHQEGGTYLRVEGGTSPGHLPEVGGPVQRRKRAGVEGQARERKSHEVADPVLAKRIPCKEKKNQEVADPVPVGKTLRQI